MVTVTNYLYYMIINILSTMVNDDRTIIKQCDLHKAFIPYNYSQ